MLIDLVFAVLMVLAIVKGVSKGFIVAVFSLLAFVIGLAAALKLSASVAVHLHEKMGIGGYWLPVISFILVFAAVVLLIRWGAALVKKAAGIVFLGWIDTLAGILLYMVMYLLVYSVILFFATRVGMVSAEAQAASKTYHFVEPFGPKAMSLLGRLIPFFSNMFADLSRFFARVSTKAS